LTPHFDDGCAACFLGHLMTLSAAQGGNMLINTEEVQTWKEAYLKVNPLQYCFCQGYKLWYFHITQSHTCIITELYIVSSSVQNLCGKMYVGGKLKPTSLKMDSHHVLPN
jgi:hypothetical protein